MRKIVMLALASLLASCAQLQQMAAYHVTEADIEHILRQQVPKLTHQANVAGIPLKMQIENMKVTIGPNNTNVVQLNTAASATLSLFGLSYPANLLLQVEGAPFYDAKEKAVFLRSVKLLDSKIEAAGYRGNLAPISNELLQVVNSYLVNNPVYRLDTENPTLKIISAMPMNLAVEQGRISFSPSNNK